MARENDTTQINDQRSIRQRSRLQFLKQLSIASSALLVACSPMRIVLKAYPGKFDDDSELRNAILRAFVTTVIPGAPADEPNLTRMFMDDFYPFHSHCPFFVADLCDRSEDLFANDRFDTLLLEQRTQVVQTGLQADATVQRLYRGAILIAQVSFYAGIYEDTRGCRLIEFNGSNYGFSTDEMCYLHTDLAREITTGGNLG